MALNVLTSKDVAAIKRLLAQVRGRPNNSSLGPSDQWDHEEFPAPEVYIALTPAAGIPALTPEVGTGTLGEGDIVGAAECDIYCVDSNDVLRPVLGLSKRVLNLSSNDIGGLDWVAIKRDKFGSWLADPPVSSTIAGSGITSASWSPNGVNVTADNTWTSETGGGASIPAGDYLFEAMVTFQAALSAPTTAAGAGVLQSVMVARLWNDTDSVAISDIYQLFGMRADDVWRSGMTTFSQRVTLSGTKTIKLQAVRNIPYDNAFGQTWTLSAVMATSATLWTTRVDYHKLG